MQNNQSPKAKQFTEELNDLLAKYQYTIVAEIQVSGKGIVPFMAIKDVIPPKKEAVLPTPVSTGKSKKKKK